jgi:hypothetical protein
MNKVMSWVGIALVASVVMASANEKLSIKIPSLTSGKCAITLLEADGIKPMADADLKLLTLKEGKEAAAAKSDRAGKCIVKLEEGRYILSVDGKNLTLVDASKNGQMAWCRIVVSENPMLVGGQEEGETVAVAGWGTTQVVMTALGAAVVIGGAWYLIDDYQDDDDDDTPATVTILPTPIDRPAPTSP